MDYIRYQTPKRFAHDVAERFAALNAPNPEFCYRDIWIKSYEEALSQALRSLVLSILETDPSVEAGLIGYSRVDKMDVVGSISVDPVIDALNAVSIVAPSLLHCPAGVRTTASALSPACVGLIARMRPQC